MFSFLYKTQSSPEAEDSSRGSITQSSKPESTENVGEKSSPQGDGPRLLSPVYRLLDPFGTFTGKTPLKATLPEESKDAPSDVSNDSSCSNEESIPNGEISSKSSEGCFTGATPTSTTSTVVPTDFTTPMSITPASAQLVATPNWLDGKHNFPTPSEKLSSHSFCIGAVDSALCVASPGNTLENVGVDSWGAREIPDEFEITPRSKNVGVDSWGAREIPDEFEITPRSICETCGQLKVKDLKYQISKDTSTAEAKDTTSDLLAGTRFLKNCEVDDDSKNSANVFATGGSLPGSSSPDVTEFQTCQEMESTAAKPEVMELAANSAGNFDLSGNENTASVMSAVENATPGDQGDKSCDSSAKNEENGSLEASIPLCPSQNRNGPIGEEAPENLETEESGDVVEAERDIERSFNPESPGTSPTSSSETQESDEFDVPVEDEYQYEVQSCDVLAVPRSPLARGKHCTEERDGKDTEENISITPGQSAEDTGTASGLIENSGLASSETQTDATELSHQITSPGVTRAASDSSPSLGAKGTAEEEKAGSAEDSQSLSRGSSEKQFEGEGYEKRTADASDTPHGEVAAEISTLDAPELTRGCTSAQNLGDAKSSASGKCHESPLTDLEEPVEGVLRGEVEETEPSLDGNLQEESQQGIEKDCRIEAESATGEPALAMDNFMADSDDGDCAEPRNSHSPTSNRQLADKEEDINGLKPDDSSQILSENEDKLCGKEGIVQEHDIPPDATFEKANASDLEQVGSDQSRKLSENGEVTKEESLTAAKSPGGCFSAGGTPTSSTSTFASVEFSTPRSSTPATEDVPGDPKVLGHSAQEDERECLRASDDARGAISGGVNDEGNNDEGNGRNKGAPSNFARIFDAPSEECGEEGENIEGNMPVKLTSHDKRPNSFSMNEFDSSQGTTPQSQDANRSGNSSTGSNSTGNAKSDIADDALNTNKSSTGGPGVFSSRGVSLPFDFETPGQAVDGFDQANSVRSAAGPGDSMGDDSAEKKVQPSSKLAQEAKSTLNDSPAPPAIPDRGPLGVQEAPTDREKEASDAVKEAVKSAKPIRQASRLGGIKRLVSFNKASAVKSPAASPLSEDGAAPEGEVSKPQESNVLSPVCIKSPPDIMPENAGGESQDHSSSTADRTTPGVGAKLVGNLEGKAASVAASKNRRRATSFQRAFSLQSKSKAGESDDKKHSSDKIAEDDGSHCRDDEGRKLKRFATFHATTKSKDDSENQTELAPEKRRSKSAKKILSKVSGLFRGQKDESNGPRVPGTDSQNLDNVTDVDGALKGKDDLIRTDTGSMEMGRGARGDRGDRGDRKSVTNDGLEKGKLRASQQMAKKEMEAGEVERDRKLPRGSDANKDKAGLGTKVQKLLARSKSSEKAKAPVVNSVATSAEKN